jgi:UDP-glucose 4-epimerase
MNNALVIGGSGFIGSHIVDVLCRNKYTVTVFDKEYDRFRERTEGVRYIRGSFQDQLVLAEALSGIDIVVHALSTSVPSTSNNSPIDDIMGNLVGTVHLLNLMLENKIKRILFISSGGTVYGIPKSLPLDEQHSTNPINSYGIIKLTIEKYLLMYEKLYGLEPIIIRGSNAYGPRQGHIGVQGFIATSLYKMLQNEEITIYGDGELIRDYIFVEDLAELCCTAIVSKEKGIFNGGSGRGYTLNEIIKIITTVSGKKLILAQMPGRLFDVKENVLCIKKAEARLGWTPKTSIESGIKKYFDWLNERLPEY